MRKPRLLILALPGILLALAGAQAWLHVPSEPCFKYDETRHVMTGLFFHDFFRDLPFAEPVDYVVRYYMQYPALGLVVWPPLFYAVEGLFMLAFGASFLAAKALVGVFAAMACIYLFLLVSRTHGRPAAAVATAVLGFAPLFFVFSRQVMLEVPTLAFALAAAHHALRYLDDGKARQVFLAAGAAACAALTRFDAVFLLLALPLLAVGRKRPDVFRRKEVWAAAALAILCVSPFYAITASQFGWMHWKAVDQGTFAGASRFMAPSNLLYYPGCLASQIGWPAVGFALVGLAAGLRRGRRAASWPYLAIIIATYATFTPMAELDPRHAIYWIPAFALFAAEGALLLGPRLAPALRPALPLVLAAGTAWSAAQEPVSYLRGFERAAGYVAANMARARFCLIDCYYDGNFIYQMRRADPGRTRWVLRGDKLFYGTLGDPHAGYKELVNGEEEILAVIARHDPEYIVVEEPRAYHRMPMADRLREVLREHPRRFRLVKSIPVETSYRGPRGMKLLIYRNRVRNLRPDARLELEMLGLRRSISTVVK